MLSVRELDIRFRTRRGTVHAVRGLDLDLAGGETLGIVGESGSGKSVTAYALMRLLETGASITARQLEYSGIDLLDISEHAMRDIRGREISMVFQNPRAALNPIRTVGRQIEDVLVRHARATRHDARGAAVAAMQAVEIQDAEMRHGAYPFELSGGMCQRVVIALALACDPRLLIADEPTTGLDITTQKTVMELIARLIRERGMSAILITHDLGLAAQYCDRIMVMKDGEVVEQGDPRRLFSLPEAAYTRMLVDANPREGATVRELLREDVRPPPPPPRPPAPGALLEVDGLGKDFHGKAGLVRAVAEVSFTLRRGSCLGLVGESGSGKSTVSSILSRLLDASRGSVRFEGEDLLAVRARDFARDPRRSAIQMVFQDATDSLNPRHNGYEAIGEPLARLSGLGRSARRERVHELADLVGLPRALLTRFPHQLSGGQKARVGIARAIAVEPKLLILDEPTAALDVSIQAVVLNLLVDLQARLDMSYLFVSHDLQVVRMLCDEVVVMRAGAVVEQGPVASVMHQPANAYTRALLDAAPRPPPRRSPDTGTSEAMHA